MYLLSCLLLLCLAAGSESYAQTSQSKLSIVQGSVVDSVSRQPLFAATISLWKVNAELTVSTVATNEDGTFQLATLPGQEYELMITNVGYAIKRLPLSVLTKSSITIAPILLSPQSISLQEVSVVAPKKLVQFENDKLIYHVADNPESVHLTTFEILRKIPLLTIDQDDNIELSGNRSYQVLLNNRPSSLFVNSISDVFKSLPASSVKSIEIILNPPAKYEAEGVGGIINIVTHQKKVIGYSGSVRAGVVVPGGPSVGGSLLAKTEKLGFSGFWNSNTGTSPTTTNHLYRLDKVNHSILEQSGESRSENSSLNIMGELSWQFNDLNLLNVHYNITRSDNGGGTSTLVSMRDADGAHLQSYRADNNFHFLSPGYDWGLDYQLGFKKNTQQLLTVSYKELSNSSNFESENLVLEKVSSSLTGGHSGNENRFSERTAQIDYTQPLKKHSFETGLKIISRFNYSDYFFDREETQTGLLVRDPGLSNQYTNRQDIYASYISLSLQLGSWMLRAGARAEQTTVAADFRTTATKIQQSYFNIIPSGTLSRRFGNATNLSVSYSQRLQRPGLYYLNPYVNNLDPYNISYGNPALKATISHVTNLALSKSFESATISVNMHHSFANNAILRFTTVGEDTVARTTYGNIGDEQSLGLSTGANFTLFKKLSLNINTSANYREYTSRLEGEFITTQGFMYNLAVNTSYRFTKYLRAGVSASYHSPSLYFQGRGRGYFAHAASLSYSFLKDRKASLSLSLNSPFQPTRRNNTVTDLTNYYLVRNYAVIMRRLSVTFYYRFGKLQSGFVRKKRGITNDDLLN